MDIKIRTQSKPKSKKGQVAQHETMRLASTRVRFTPSPPVLATTLHPQTPTQPTGAIHLNFSQIALTQADPEHQLANDSAPEMAQSIIGEGNRGVENDGDTTGGELGPLLQEAVASPTGNLPQRTLLEQLFGTPLGDVRVHRGDAAQAALAQLETPAAVYAGHMLLAEPTPSLYMLAHEVVHVLQSRQGTKTSNAAAESEAQKIARNIEQRAHLTTPDFIALTDSFAPLQPDAAVIPDTIAAFSDPPANEQTPPTNGGSAPQAEEAAVATVEQPVAEVAGAGAEGAVAAEGGAVSAGAPGEALLEAPNPPPPGVDEAALAAHSEALAQAQEALEAADTTTGVMDAYAAAPPTIKAQMAGQISSRVNGVMAAETQSLQEETPPLEAKLSHEIPPGAGTLEVPSPDAVPVNVETQPPAPAPELDLPPVPEPGHFQANDDILAAVTRAQPAEDDRARQVSGALEDVQTSDPGIPIRPSETPSVPLEGETDPERLHNQLEEGKTQGRDHLAAAQAGVLNGPGPEQVQPISVDESHPVENLTVPTAAEIAAPEGADAYLAMNLPPEVQVAFDQNNGAEMQASVAGAQTQIAQATETRDQQHQAEVQNAQQQNQALVQEADQNQRDRVGEARAQIQSERQRTLDEQNAAVQSVESEASERQNQDRAEIDGRVQRDEEAVQQRYDQTERDAQAEIESGERRAEERQRQAERDAENQSWWERAVNFVRDAFNALVSAINSIFDAVRAAVNVLLDAARDFAIGLINAVSSFIQSAIAAFGAFLTGLVQALLSDIFPELAARLTAAINAAVTAAQQAVEAVAEGLRQGVNALVEGLRAAINAVLDAYQAAINTALAVLEAALTGDWGALARRILESVLSLLGIDPQAFYAFIGQVLDTIQLIIDDPGGFLGNVLGAVVGGIQNFATNFLQHLQAGIIGWLTGALGSAGITLPESFDLMGVLSLVQQILGLTWENIRERAVRLVGERGVQVLEFIGSYIETLITSGWAGLWERIQSDLATLRDMVLEQIRNFLVERVILAAIQWLAAFNPIGGIVRIVMTIYNFIMFLRDQLQRLFALAQTVIGALSDIARGNLAPAMQAVEGVLAGLLPVVIDLLARILGLGNVGGRVREIMQSIQDTLWGAIDRLLDRVLASFRGGGDAVAGAEGAGPEEQAEPGTEADTRRFTLPLNFPGESHTVTVTVDRGDVTASIASRRQGLLFDVLSAAITEIEERDRRYPRNANPALLRQLYEARREISDEAIMQEFTTRGRPGYRPSSGPPESSPAFIEFVEVRLNELINLMRVAFENDRVHTLDQVFATDELTGPRFLPVQTRGSRWIRPNLYEGFRSWQSFRDPIVAAEVRRITTDVRTAKTTNDYSIWNRLDAAHQLPRNAQLATFQPADVANVEYHLDHIQPVARHWNTAGNNTDDSARDTFYFDPNNLRVVTQEFNLSRGSENENYVNFVETNFTSRLAEANIRSAREILDGGTPRRFLDDRGSPIP